MDTYEATNILLSKIKKIDPENASKIMGYILIQGHNDSDLLSLALGSETLLHKVILQARNHLGLSTNAFSIPSAPPSPSPLNSISRTASNHNPFSQSSPRVTSFLDFAKNPSPHSWPASGMMGNSNGTASISPKSSPFLSYDNIRAALVAPSPTFGGNGSGDANNNISDLINENQLEEYFSFLDDFPPRSEEILDPRVQLASFDMSNVDTHLHRRRFSESDACFGSEDGSFGPGYRPCLFFARGFCKNGDNCKYIHSGFDGDSIPEVAAAGGGVLVGSPSEMEGFYLQRNEEMMRMKAVQQQRLAYNKYMNFLLQQESDSGSIFRMGAASVSIGDEIHKFGQFPERNDFLAMAMEEKVNSSSRQIYLTFPADSNFKDEDVSNYFSTFGPVQDVRIPYQQKRMFGFVTFVHPETVKLILSRGNPHFICDSRVLVKPYKEKGKVASNRRQQHLQQQLMDRGNLSPCSNPSSLDPREIYDVQLGARMLYNTQEIMLRRKLEQAKLQQAIELQGRRLINLQLPDLRGDFIHHHQRSLSAGSPISLSPYAPLDRNLNLTSDAKNRGVLEDKGDTSATTIASTVGDQKLQHEGTSDCIESNGTVNSNVESFNLEGCGGNERCGSMVEHGLPDSPFASPKKSLRNQSDFSLGLIEAKESTPPSEFNTSVPKTTSSDAASHK